MSQKIESVNFDMFEFLWPGCYISSQIGLTWRELAYSHVGLRILLVIINDKSVGDLV